MKIENAKLRSSLFLLTCILFLPCSPAVAQTLSAPARITQAVDETNLTVLRGNVHPLARGEFDQGAVSDGQPLHRMLLLLQRGADQEAALQKLLDDQQNKSSANYHAWLTPAQFGQQFGPADADIQTVTNWLQSHGFQITNVTAGRTVIEFSGNAAQVRSAFHTTIHKYMVNGEAHMANATDPQIPAALAPVVAGPVSLNNFPRKSYARILGQFRRTIGKPGLQPLFTFPDPYTGTTFYGMGPGDFATIYNSKPLIAAGNDGTGQTIAVVGETNINIRDVQQFRQMFSLPANFDATNVILNGEDPGITSTDEEGEADLDVEWSGAVAPGATVKFIVSASTPASAGIDLSALYIVEQNLAGAMSESYGQCEQSLGTAGNAFYNKLWEQAAAQGITVILSAGDGGSAGCDDFNSESVATLGLAVSGLASTPFNVSVGGTDFDEVNTWATFWNSSNGSLSIVAGSGGPSTIYAKPKWQMGVAGMPNDSHRDQPDISLFASPGFDGTGYVYCQSDETISESAECDLSNASAGILDFGIVGGTSASAPSFAGIMALVNQYEAAHGGTNRQGNANFVLYALANKVGASCTSGKTEASGCIFNDVSKGNSSLPTGLPGVGTNSVPCKGGTLNCSSALPANNGVLVEPSHTTTEAWTATADYDMTTGLGTLNVNNLTTSWASVSTIPTTTTLTLSPTTGITHGTSENVTVGITVKPNSGTGVPAGDVSLIATLSGGATQGLDHFTLASGAITGAKTQSLPGGTYSVSAHYAGDGTNAPSDSTPVQVTVGKGGSHTFIVVPTFDSSGNQLNGNASSAAYGSSYVIRMYVTDQNGMPSPTGPPSPTCLNENLLTCPTGTVSLTANGSQIDGGVFTLNTGGYTRDIAPTLPGGIYSLVAAYSGDTSYASSTSATDPFTVTPASVQISGPYFPSGQPLVNSPITIEADIRANIQNSIAPTGSISFFDGTTLIPGTVTISAGPGSFGAPAVISGILNTKFTTSGVHPITAQYSGDTSYSGITSQPSNLDIVYQPGLTQSVSATAINIGQTITITATATSGNKSPAMSGQFTFNGSITLIPGPVTGTPGVDANGNQILTATATTVPQGTESIFVTYSGDQNYEGVGTQGTLINVNVPDFTLPNSLAFTATAGQPASVTFNVAPVSSAPSQVALSTSNFSISGATLTLNPSPVSLNGSAVPVTLTLTSIGPSGTAPSVAMAQAKKEGYLYPFSFSANKYLWLSLSVGGILALLFPIASRKGRSLGPVVLATGLCLEILILGCGGGGGGIVGGGGGGGSSAVPTSISLSSASPKSNSGPITVTATVTSSKPIGGTVTIFVVSGGLNSEPLPVVNGQVTWAVPAAFKVGTVGCTAQYSGDAMNLPSQTSTPFDIVFTGPVIFSIQGSTGNLTHTMNVTLTLQ